MLDFLLRRSGVLAKTLAKLVLLLSRDLLLFSKIFPSNRFYYRVSPGKKNVPMVVFFSDILVVPIRIGQKMAAR
jgi:hypothetical protein